MITNRLLLALPYLLGIALAVMAFAQLFSFEAFTETIISYQLLPHEGSLVLAIVLVALEIFALPFLARLWMHRFSARVSALCVVLSPLLWTALLAGGLLLQRTPSRSGLFGGLLSLPPDGLSLLFCFVLLGLGIGNFMMLAGPKLFKHRRTS